MRFLLKKYFLVVISVFILTQLISGVTIKNGFNGLIYASFILFILFYIAKPIANLILLPINILSLNLFSWILNIFIIYLWTKIAGNIEVTQWVFNGFSHDLFTVSPFSLSKFYVIVFSSVILTLIRQIISWILK